MTRRSLLYWLALAGLVAAFIVVTWLRVWVEDTATEGPGMRPAFSLPDLSGEARAIAEWDGQVLVVNFWATWCPPCVEEIPELVDVQSRFGQKGAQVIGVALDERENIEGFLREVPVNYPVLHGATRAFRVLDAYGNERGTLPYTVVVGRDGEIHHRLPRPTDAKELGRLIEPLL
ncbi:TlpA family protein disulfide reductase [Ectothiorhodospiraceae bacterium WFHF3C12]|nr:TlpA family protein disulfide reductase [Ectothiorhodospiraceae bacterium WFHF3C12]